MHVVKCMSQNQNLSCFEVFDINLGSSSVDCCKNVACDGSEAIEIQKCFDSLTFDDSSCVDVGDGC